MNFSLVVPVTRRCKLVRGSLSFVTDFHAEAGSAALTSDSVACTLLSSETGSSAESGQPGSGVNDCL